MPHLARLHRAGLVPLLLAPLSLALACNGQDFQVVGIQSNLVASPGLTDFGTLAVGDLAQSLVTLQTSSGSVDVLAIELVGDGSESFAWTEVELPTVDEDQPVDLIFTFAPQVEGYHWAELRITTDETEDEVHTVDLRGLAVLGQVKAWPLVLDFGPVEGGESRTRALTLLNEGGIDLVLDRVEMSGEDALSFTVAGLPLTLQAGQQLDLDVDFHATNTDPAGALATLDFGGGADLPAVTLRANDCSTAESTLYDQDGDGVSWCADDCDDLDADSHPGADEVCDGADNDCDGAVDEGTGCVDDDGDGYSEDDGDCHDGDASVSPDGPEVPANGIDDDCDGVVDDGAEDADGDGFTTPGGDCDDAEPLSNPGELEVEDGIDNDCDGDVDEGTEAFDDDGDGWTERLGDCDDTDDDVHPGATEDADWVDDDCDGTVDEGTTNSDDDGDGFSERGGDCNDANPDVNPGEPEITGDRIDNDCDGRTE